jgi:hypothetical protein
MIPYLDLKTRPVIDRASARQFMEKIEHTTIESTSRVDPDFASEIVSGATISKGMKVWP